MAKEGGRKSERKGKRACNQTNERGENEMRKRAMAGGLIVKPAASPVP